MAVIFNEEFRDSSSQASFPFTPESTLIIGQRNVPLNAFLDASIYPVGTYSAPFRFAYMEQDPSTNSIIFTIHDSEDILIGHAVCDLQSDTAYIKDPYSNMIGVLVYSEETLQALWGAAEHGRIKLASDAFVFTAGCCRSIHSEGTLFVNTSDDLYTGEILFTGANGIHFEEDGQAISINMYGELYTQQRPIKTINNKALEHCWLAAHPDSAIRIRTDASGIIIGKSQDYGNAT